MSKYTQQEIQDTLKIIESSIVSCEKVRPKLKTGSASFSLNTNRLKALYLSKAVLLNQNNAETKEEFEKAAIQIASIKRKSTTGLGNAKEGSAAYTRFSRLIFAMDVILEHLKNAMDQR